MTDIKLLKLKAEAHGDKLNPTSLDAKVQKKWLSEKKAIQFFPGI
jgi:hypothetical protein